MNRPRLSGGKAPIESARNDSLASPRSAGQQSARPGSKNWESYQHYWVNPKRSHVEPCTRLVRDADLDFCARLDHDR